jgi:tetratricopeptide (TPR) repeat protein
MNKLSYILTVLFLMLNLGINAQTETATGTPDANFSIYKSKLRKSDEGLTEEKKTSNPKFWLSRAEKKEWQDEEGNQWEELTYEKIKIKMKNGVVDSFEELVKLHDDPLPEALKALDKAQETDVDGKLTKKIKEDYDLLKKAYERQAVEQFYKPDYKGSFESFATINNINERPIMEGLVDTAYLYFAGVAASRADLTDKSIEYYEKALSYNYPEPDIYVFLKEKYFSVGDTAKGVEVLEDGFKRFPDHQAILIELINYYLNANKGEQALEYLLIAQKDDPDNLSFIFAEATLYDKMGEQEKALETYNRCLEINPRYFNAYYNIGVMFYNKAVEMYKEADNIKDPKEYGVAKDAADEVLKKSLPYMEKAHEIDPKEASTIETLKTLYYRTQNTEKYEEMKALLESMPAKEEKKKEIQ